MTRMAGCSSLPMHRQDRDPAIVPFARASSTDRQAVRPPDQREGAARPKKPRWPPRASVAAAAGRDMGAAARSRSGEAAVLVVEGRVHENVIGACRRAGPCAAKAARRAPTSSDGPRSIAQSRCARYSRAASSESAGSISTSVTSQPGTRASSARPAAPTPGAEIRPHVWPASRRDRSRQQDRVMAETMAALAVAGDASARPSMASSVTALRVSLRPHRGAARGRGPHPAAAAARLRRCSSATRTRRGRTPSEPSSTLIFWSSTTCGCRRR